MKEYTMSEGDNNNTQQLLGRLEIKMENLDKGNDKLGAKLDEITKEVSNLKNDVTEIKAKQAPAPVRAELRWPTIAMGVGSLVTIATIIVGLILVLHK